MNTKRGQCTDHTFSFWGQSNQKGNQATNGNEVTTVSEGPYLPLRLPACVSAVSAVLVRSAVVLWGRS